MSSKINLQTCEYARKSSIFQDNQLIYSKTCWEDIITAGMADPFCDRLGSKNDSTDLCGCQRDPWVYIHFIDHSDCILLP